MSTSTSQLESDNEVRHEYTISGRRYGKKDIKLIYIKRDGLFHTVKEFEVETRLKISSTKEFTQGNNSDIVGTDAQLNTVYLLAKKYGIENAEKFALILATHFLERYSHIEEVQINVEEYPWQRISQTDGKNYTSINSRQEHNHAFVLTPTEIHYCKVVMQRTDPKQKVTCGIKGMRLLKTANATFFNYITDEFRSDPDKYDRLFSTVVDCSWEYLNINDVDYCQDWNTVKNIINWKFAGDTKVGTVTPCLQNLQYLIGKEILEVLPQVSLVSMKMPNKQFYNFDTTPYQTIAPGENEEVFITTDKPSSEVFSLLTRNQLS